MTPPDARKTVWQEWLPAAFFLVPFALLLLAMLTNSQATKSDRQRCVQSDVELQTLEGTLRKAGGDFFVESDGGWKWITHSCEGKTAYQCYEANPGMRMLRDNVGRPVTVEFCDKHAVAYSVSGARFDDVFPR